MPRPCWPATTSSTTRLPRSRPLATRPTHELAEARETIARLTTEHEELETWRGELERRLTRVHRRAERDSRRGRAEDEAAAGSPPGARSERGPGRGSAAWRRRAASRPRPPWNCCAAKLAALAERHARARPPSARRSPEQAEELVDAAQLARGAADGAALGDLAGARAPGASNCSCHRCRCRGRATARRPRRPSSPSHQRRRRRPAEEPTLIAEPRRSPGRARGAASWPVGGRRGRTRAPTRRSRSCAPSSPRPAALSSTHRIEAIALAAESEARELAERELADGRLERTLGLSQRPGWRSGRPSPSWPGA